MELLCILGVSSVSIWAAWAILAISENQCAAFLVEKLKTETSGHENSVFFPVTRVKLPKKYDKNLPVTCEQLPGCVNMIYRCFS